MIVQTIFVLSLQFCRRSYLMEPPHDNLDVYCLEIVIEQRQQLTQTNQCYSAILQITGSKACNFWIQYVFVVLFMLVPGCGQVWETNHVVTIKKKCINLFQQLIQQVLSNFVNIYCKLVSVM